MEHYHDHGLPQLPVGGLGLGDGLQRIFTNYEADPTTPTQGGDDSAGQSTGGQAPHQLRQQAFSQARAPASRASGEP